ncbi:MAG: hypothetical protein HYS32_01895 [Candidatus Woesearchaeota archaeon]|nr:MAG: hypothetical protein HYS32_01895 [Candidatus Woesearchaeota archaeon]
MPDIFDTALVCEDCNKKTIKDKLVRDGFMIRMWICPSCEKKWLHPLDEENYKEFQKLKSKNFQVKLRLVGNSYTVSIPREIIEYQEEIDTELAKLINLSLDSPGKVTLVFRREIRKVY